MKINSKVPLSAMMFLQFFVWGSWYGQLGKYMTDGLHATGSQVGTAYAAFSIAMIVSPFFVGMLADRFFAAQRVLAVLNLMGAAILYYLFTLNDSLTLFDPTTQTQVIDSFTKEPVENAAAWSRFYWTMLLYCLTFAPTIALTSSIALRHISNPEKEFPLIRVFGTLSWITVTNVVGFMGVGDKSTIFMISAGTALVLSVFALTLPNTPPTATGPSSFAQIIGKDAFVLFRDRSFAIFFIASVLVCIPLSFYYTWGNSSVTDAFKMAHPDANPASFNIENIMSLGQASEVIFMVLLTIAYPRLGVKKILLIALLAWIVRFLFFGFGDAASSLWMLYIAIVLHGVCFDFFFVTGYLYADEKAGDKIKSQAQGLISLATYGIGMFIGSIVAGKVKDYYTNSSATFPDWQSIWMVPAAIAVVVLLLFFLFFKDSGKSSAAKQ